jgi:hypothetical protein
VCPISLLRMDDINPAFKPRVLTPKALNGTGLPKQDLKGKARLSSSDKVGDGNISSFFSASVFLPIGTVILKLVTTSTKDKDRWQT